MYVDSDYLQWTWSGIYEFTTFLKTLNLAPGSRLLELGCGTGRYAIPLLKLGYSVTGVDISRESLKVLKGKAKKHGLIENLELVESDFKEGLFDGKRRLFDGAYCINTFYMIDSIRSAKEKVFFNLVASVENGGLILLMTPNPFNPFLYVYYLLSPQVSWQIEKNFRCCTPRYLRDLCEKTKLRDVKIRGYGMFPTKFIDLLPAFGKVNEGLCKLPIVKNFSLFLLTTGKKAHNA